MKRNRVAADVSRRKLEEWRGLTSATTKFRKRLP